MPRPKRVKAEERKTITLTYNVIPYFAVVSTDPKLSGLSGIGKTAREAVASMRSVARRTYPFAQYDIIERTDTRDLMLATSWKEPVFD